MTITIDETDLDSVDKAAAAAGVSRSEFMARAATREAMKSARDRFLAALAANPVATAEHDAAMQHALSAGRRARDAAAARYGDAA